MNKRPATVALLLVLAQICAPSSFRACVVGSESVWDLVQSADLIVVGRVEAIIWDPTAANPDTSYSSREILVIEVIDTWKGPSMRELRLDFPFGATRAYPIGRVVVAFTSRGETIVDRLREKLDAAVNLPEPTAGNDDDDEEIGRLREDRADALAETRRWLGEMEVRAPGKWFGMGVPREYVSPAEDDREELGSLIRKAVELEANGRASRADRRAWLVAATGPLLTRRSAVYQLMAEQSEAELTPRELAGIAEAFVARPSLDYADSLMLSLLAKHADPDVDRTAASVVEAGLQMSPRPDWLKEILRAALQRYDPDFEGKVQRDEAFPWGLPIPEAADDDPLGTIWELAHIGLDIPRVAPAEAPAQPGGKS